MSFGYSIAFSSGGMIFITYHYITVIVIIIIIYLTSAKIQANDKTNYKSHSLQLGLFTQDRWHRTKINKQFCS